MARRSPRSIKRKARKPVGVAGEPIEQPTPEMQRRVSYQFGPVKTEMNVQIGSAYRRQPLYITMAKKDGRFSPDQFAALQEYRLIFDRSERSPFASCLANPQGRGRALGPASVIHASPAIVEAKRKLSLLERGLGLYLNTMRAVVLYDRSFSEIAIERFGSRRRSWIAVDQPVVRDGQPVKVDGKPIFHAVHREDIVPRSGRDRQKIADEFNRGLTLLTLASELLRGGSMAELWVHPRDDGSAIIHRAACAPNGLFRLWGPSGVVNQVVDDLLEANDDRLVFSSAIEARDTLLRIEDGRLHKLDPDELAA